MAKKRLGGFSNIHVAPLTGSTYSAPVPLTGAKSVEAELTYEPVQFYSDNKIDFNDNIFAGGEGTLTLSGLTTEDYATLFGANVNDGGVVVKTNDISPDLALLFERKKLGSNSSVRYVLYAVKFQPPNISAATIEGSLEEEVAELSFTIREFDNNEVFFLVDQDAEEIGTKHEDFFDDVQFAE